MYVDTSKITKDGKTYTRHLLRDSYREDGKVKHHTVANLSHCTEEEIGAIKLALRHKHELSSLGNVKESISLKQGLSVGAVWVICEVAKELGIVKALGASTEGKLALWQIIARIIDQGSRLSAVRLAGSHAACDVLSLGSFNEDSLYENLDWLAKEQSRIEDELFAGSKRTACDLFLYDVTSSYLEGEHNELAAFGYNRDGKKGKRQIVIGLLCDKDGDPVSIEVFCGNTQDPKTFNAQIEKVKERFGIEEVTFVGDRGMIKSSQIALLKGAEGCDFHYITAITKPQIEKLLTDGVLQMSLFDQELAEVCTDDGLRYVLRRNPVRALEISNNREEKLSSLLLKVEERNAYLDGHKRASPKCALRKVSTYAEKLKISSWVVLSVSERKILLEIDQAALRDESSLDGCYVLKTDLSQIQATKELVHSRYKDLALVEKAFRFSKTVHLEMRPIYLQLEERTRAHAFVVMLAYKIIRHLAACWSEFNLTVEEALHELATLCLTEVRINDKNAFNEIPRPRDSVVELLKAANVRLPKAIPLSGINVHTKKKLQLERK